MRNIRLIHRKRTITQGGDGILINRVQGGDKGFVFNIFPLNADSDLHDHYTINLIIQIQFIKFLQPKIYQSQLTLS